MPGTAHDNKLHGAEDVLPSQPCADFGECIRADEEEQRIAGRERSTHFLDSVDGIASSALGFEARRLQNRVSSAGQFDHPVAVFVWRESNARLMRRNGGGHQEHAIQGEAPRGFASHGQMREMDRIEGTAEEGESQFLLQNLDLNPAEVHLHGRSGMQLQADVALGPLGIVYIGRDFPVQL